MSKRRRSVAERAKSAENAISPEKGRDFDPTAVEESSTHRNFTAGVVPVGTPLSEREYAKLKKDAETSRWPRTKAQEDGHGNSTSSSGKQ